MGFSSLAVAAELPPLCSLVNTKRGSFLCQRRKHGHVSYYKKPIFCNIKSNITATATTGSPSSSSCGGKVLEIKEIEERCRKWIWKGKFSINYFVSCNSDSQSSPGPPLLLVHGFGASIPHWRRNIDTLAKNYTVYAVDLLGFGASDKPEGFSYTMEEWAQLILDFLDEVIQKPTVLIGNSVGSLACVIAASGLVLLNCSGGMNNKAIVDDWRIKLFLPLLWLIDFLLKQRAIASWIFERVKERDTLRNILLSVYGNKESVDEDLVESLVDPVVRSLILKTPVLFDKSQAQGSIIRGPACDEGALDAFVSIVTGPPGPNPVTLMPALSIPILVLWGDQDPFTPIDGPVGKYFSSLPSQLSNVSLCMLEGVGHCPHDDEPDLVHDSLLPWLASLVAS
uniref:AB hydrolase-1 domain-containing protein n=1 Tax=Salix viminalis TaxID=40686 RepID=A0A6N2N245_SALVM